MNIILTFLPAAVSKSVASFTTAGLTIPSELVNLGESGGECDNLGPTIAPGELDGT